METTQKAQQTQKPRQSEKARMQGAIAAFTAPIAILMTCLITLVAKGEGSPVEYAVLALALAGLVGTMSWMLRRQRAQQPQR